MSLKSEKPIEKGYFTFDELCKRWDCDNNEIEQCIESKKLRAAALVKEVPIEALMKKNESSSPDKFYLEQLFSLESVDGRMSVSRLLDAWFKPEPNLRDFKVIKRVEGVTYGQEQLKYLLHGCVIPKKNIIQSPTNGLRYLHQYEDKYNISVVDENDEIVLPVEKIIYTKHPDEMEDDSKEPIIVEDIILQRIDNKYFKYVTKDDRDRFEKEYGVFVADASSLNSRSHSSDNKDNHPNSTEEPFINPPMEKNRDDWYRAIEAMMHDYKKKYSKFPDFTEAWNFLWENQVEGLEIKAGKDKYGDIALIMGGSSICKTAMRKRFKRYNKPN